MKLLFAASLSVFAMTAAAADAMLDDPGPVESLDMAAGPGGRAPQPPFTFIEEDKGGTSPKVTVRDAAGSQWIVKFGDEAKPETFASRIVWAAGYFAEPTYFVKEGRIEGAAGLKRTKAFIVGGRFQNARFELKDDAPRDKRWSLGASKFKGSRELAGLKVLFVLLSNWDVKPENLSVVEANGKAMYAVTDWGATMGHPAELMDRSKWDCQRYEADSQTFLEGVDNGFVVFRYQGKQGEEIRRNIKVEDVQWLMQRLGKLSDAQIDEALKASGATPEEVACFGKAFRSRLALLKAVNNSPSDGTVVTRTRREIKVITKPK